MKIKEMFDIAQSQELQSVMKFMKDMRKAKLKLQYYRGRNFWHGPAVVCDNLQDVLSNTKVKCYCDNMGKGYIVYPGQSLVRDSSYDVIR